MKYDWVTQEGRIEERVLRNEIKNIVKNQKLSNAQIVAFYTDEIVIDLFWKNGREVDLNREMEKNFLSQERLRLLLELRIFNETKELKIWRSVIGETFFFRIADDKKINEENQFKVENYLDIDEKVGKLEENNKQENTNNIEENIAEEDTTINISETEQSSEEMAEEQNDDDKNIVKEVENEKKNS